MKKRLIVATFALILLTTITTKQRINITKFNLKKINIENIFLLKEEDLKKLLIPINEKNLLLLRNKEIEQLLIQNTFIESFIIKKKYPDTLKIKIIEKKPIAILFEGKKKFYLSEKIELMQFKNLPNYQNLPYIFGKKEEFKILHENLFEIDFPIDLIKKYTLLESNRWDLETINNKLIKLPLKNYNKSLKNYLVIMNKNEFKKYKVYDYRLKNQLIMK
jgi:cell division protein FtsQ